MKKLRIIDKERVKVQFQLELAQVWVGFFWMTREAFDPNCKFLHIMVCFIPLLPLHITILRKG